MCDQSKVVGSGAVVKGRNDNTGILGCIGGCLDGGGVRVSFVSNFTHNAMLMECWKRGVDFDIQEKIALLFFFICSHEATTALQRHCKWRVQHLHSSRHPLEFLRDLQRAEASLPTWDRKQIAEQ